MYNARSNFSNLDLSKTPNSRKLEMMDLHIMSKNPDFKRRNKIEELHQLILQSIDQLVSPTNASKINSSLIADSENKQTMVENIIPEVVLETSYGDIAINCSFNLGIFNIKLSPVKKPESVKDPKEETKDTPRNAAWHDSSNATLNGENGLRELYREDSRMAYGTVLIDFLNEINTGRRPAGIITTSGPYTLPDTGWKLAYSVSEYENEINIILY